MQIISNKSKPTHSLHSYGLEPKMPSALSNIEMHSVDD